MPWILRELQVKSKTQVLLVDVDDLARVRSLLEHRIHEIEGVVRDEAEGLDHEVEVGPNVLLELGRSSVNVHWIVKESTRSTNRLTKILNDRRKLRLEENSRVALSNAIGQITSIAEKVGKRSKCRVAKSRKFSSTLRTKRLRNIVNVERKESKS